MFSQSLISKFGLVLASLAMVVGGLGCASTNLQNWVFSKPGLKYSIGSLGKGWRPIKVSENDVAFYHKTFVAIVQVNSTCRTDFEDASLATLTDHLFNGLTDRKIVHRANRTVDRRAALYTELFAKLDGVSIKASLLVLKKNECVFDFSYMARPWNYGRGIGDFYRLIYGFRVLP